MQRPDVVEYYKPGRKPKNAPESDDEDEEYDETRDYGAENDVDDEELEEIPIVSSAPLPVIPVNDGYDDDDPRLAVLKSKSNQYDSRDKKKSVLSAGPASSRYHGDLKKHDRLDDEDDIGGYDNDEQDDEDDVHKRHEMARKVLQAEPYIIAREEGKKSRDLKDRTQVEYSDDDDDDESDESDDYGDDEGPMLKPVFLKKEQRTTIEQRVKDEEEEAKRLEEEEERLYEERRQQTLKMIEQDRQQELGVECDEIPKNKIESVNTDDEDEEIEYEKWRLREQERIQRDRKSKKHI